MKFNPNDFILCTSSKNPCEMAADISNKKLSEWLNMALVVYCSPVHQGDGLELWDTERTKGDTHKAKVIDIEELKE